MAQITIVAKQIKASIPEIIAKETCELAIKLNDLNNRIKKILDMKKLDLVEKLKNAPIGLKLYSPLIGDVTFVEVLENFDYPISVDGIDGNYRFASNGRYYNPNYGECLLFPSKECRDWNRLQIPKVGDRIQYDSKEYTVSGLRTNGFVISVCGTVSTIVYYTDTFKIIGEPKFKMGDRVIINKRLRRIITVEDSRYLAVLEIHSCGQNPMYFQEDEIRLATKEELRDNYCLMLDENNNLVRWMPKHSESYFYVKDNGLVGECAFEMFRLSVSNCFPTKEMAKQAAKEMTETFKNFNPNK